MAKVNNLGVSVSCYGRSLGVLADVHNLAFICTLVPRFFTTSCVVMVQASGNIPSSTPSPLLRRARVDCKACNARRVNCDAAEGQPCWHCRTRQTSCELIQSRRGKYVGVGLQCNYRAPKLKTSQTFSAEATRSPRHICCSFGSAKSPSRDFRSYFHRRRHGRSHAAATKRPRRGP